MIQGEMKSRPVRRFFFSRGVRRRLPDPETPLLSAGGASVPAVGLTACPVPAPPALGYAAMASLVLIALPSSSRGPGIDPLTWSVDAPGSRPGRDRAVPCEAHYSHRWTNAMTLR